MRFRHRSVIIISVLAVFVLVAVGASMLFAAPNTDPDRDEAMAALAVLNRYFNGLPGPVPGPAPTSVPTPSLAPTPTPTPTATPVPSAAGIPDFERNCLHWVDVPSRYIRNPHGYRIIDNVSVHIDVTAINPSFSSHLNWSYGFTIFEALGGRVNLFVNHQGEWVVSKGHLFTGSMLTSNGAIDVEKGPIIDTGVLAEHGIEFTATEGGRNRLSFRTRTEEAGYGFFVNGKEVPVNWSAVGFPTDYERYNSNRHYYLNDHYGGNYEDLCKVNSWEATLTSTPPPTATPVPKPTPIPVLADCRQRDSGTIGGGGGGAYYVVSQTSKHVDVQFVNPDRERHWRYGFRITESHGNPRFVLHIDRHGEWVYTKRRNSTDEIIDSGYLPDDVPWHTAAGERNQMTFFTRSANGRDANRVFSRYEDGYRVKINGVDMGKEFVEAFNANLPEEYERHRLGRTYSLFSARNRQQYENLCTVNSW